MDSSCVGRVVRTVQRLSGYVFFFFVCAVLCLTVLCFFITHTHTHTHTGTLAMMLGPQQVPQEHSSRAGLIMVFFLTTGLAVGSWVGVGLKQLMDHTDL